MSTETGKTGKTGGTEAASGTSGGKLVPWLAFILGATASIAANVAHAAARTDGKEGAEAVGPLLAAAWAPLALLLVAEMVFRTRHVGGRWLAVVRWSGTAVVAAVAAVVSYEHMHELLVAYGESDLVTYLLPLSVDGMMVVASVALAAGAGHRVPERAAPVPSGMPEAATVPEAPASGTDSVPERADEAATVPGDVPDSVPEVADVPDVVPHSVPLPAPLADRSPASGTDDTATVPSLPDAADERETARDYVRAALRDGRKVTGKDVAGEFGKSERWGRMRVSEVKEERTADA